MSSEDPEVLAAQPTREFERRVGRLFFGMSAGVCAVAVFVMGSIPLALSPAGRWALLTACAAVSALCLIVEARLPRLDLPRSIFRVGCLLIGLVGAVSWGVGEGIHAAAVGFLSLLSACIVVVCGLNRGLAASALSVAVLCALLVAEIRGGLPGVNAVPESPLWSRMVTELLLLASAAMVGLLVGQVARRSVAQATLREQRFRQLLDMAADWYWELDHEHRYVHVQQRYPGASGLTLEEQLGHRPWEIDRLGLSEAQLDAHRADLEAHRPFSGLLARRMGPDGGIRHVSLSGEPRFDGAGRFTGFWGVGRDVTAEVAAQRAIAISEARYRELFTRSPSAVLLHRDGRVFDANDAAARLLGHAGPPSMAGLEVASLLGDGPPALTAFAPAGGAGRTVTPVEVALLDREGRTVVAEATSVAVDTPSGPAVMTLLFDVTERLAAQTALRRSEALLSSLVAASPDMITLTELRTGRYLMVNDTFSALTGYSREEVVGRTSIEIHLWADPQDRAALVREVQQHGLSRDRPCVIVGRHGQRLQLMVSASAFELDGERYLVTNSRDVSASERSRLEREAILENASVGICFTRHGRIEVVNRRFEQMLGWPAGALVGRHGRALWPDSAEYDALAMETRVRLARRSTLSIERRMLHHDGHTVWCRLMVRAIDLEDANQGLVWIVEDITAQRAAAAALAQARDEAQAANRAKSAFLANTSHELRTPLNGLLGLARLALALPADDPRRESYLRLIVDSGQTLAAIISDILDFSRIEAGHLELEAAPFDPHVVAVAVQQLNQVAAADKGLTLELQAARDLPPRLVGDAVRVRQILSNYVANALKFTDEGAVRIRLMPLVPGHLGAAGDQQPASGLRIEVEDDGPGIDPQVQARLFRPFTQADQSTTRRFGGTGLGLSICRELAEAMGGRAGVRSTPGEGSCFWAELPLPALPAGSDPGPQGAGWAMTATGQPAGRGPCGAPWVDTLSPPEVQAPAAAPTPARPALQLPPGRRVLVVEDNPVNMMVATALLETAGAQVRQARDGQEAIAAVEAAEAGGEPLHLVLMDVQMPVMGGREATERLRQRHPPEALPIVALTAAALVDERDRALDAGMNDFLTKPIDLAALQAVLERYLGLVDRPS